MTQTTARLKKTGKNFEIIVDLDGALAFKRGKSPTIEAEGGRIFSDTKKGFAASNSDLQKAFGTEDVDEIAKKIVKEGEVLITQEHRDAEQEKKFNRVIDFLVRNAIDPKTGNPHTAERIKNAIEEAHVNIKNVPIENQINEIVKQLSRIIPIRLETKKIKIVIPAIYTGKAYGVIDQYKGEENWLDDGSLEVIVNVPAGMIMDFYDKLNSATRGSAVTEEVKANVR